MRRLFFLSISILNFTFAMEAAAFGQKLAESTLSRNGFGPNDRVSQISVKNKKAKNYIGRLVIASGGLCTASLVGKDLILTNAHCVLKAGKLKKGGFNFELGYNRGATLGISAVSRAWWGKFDRDKKNWKDDWAILKLVKPLGKKFGYFGVTLNPDLHQPVSVAGYGKLFSQKYLTAHEGCDLKELNQQNIFLHDCDISTGDSGAPLFECRENGCYIKALQSGEKRNGRTDSAFVSQFSDSDANMAIPPSSFYKKLVELKAKSK